LRANNRLATEHFEIGLVWFAPALMLAVVYLFIVYRSFAGKVRPKNKPIEGRRLSPEKHSRLARL